MNSDKNSYLNIVIVYIDNGKNVFNFVISWLYCFDVQNKTVTDSSKMLNN